MGCPRCDGSLAAYTLQDSQAAICDQCGWVGISTSLSGGSDAGSPESWEDVLDQVSEQRVTIDRDRGGLPSIVSKADTESTVDMASEAKTTSDGLADSDNGDDDSLDTLKEIDPSDADQFQTSGIQTLDELATADPDDLADETDLPIEQVRTYVRQAAIQLITKGEETEDED